MNEAIAASLDSSSAARRIDDGRTVATVAIPNPDSRTSPRCLVTRNPGPMTDWAAVAPSRTSTLGLTIAISASSHGRHART